MESQTRSQVGGKEIGNSRDRCLGCKVCVKGLQEVLASPHCRISGNSSTTFVNELDTSVIIAVGYRRVLYGDHGPYIEFTRNQIRWESFPVVKPDKPSHAYYDERFTLDQHVMAYEQRKTVRDKPNPPPGVWSANNDRVDTGYADYQPGYVYVSADCLDVLPQSRPNKRAKTAAASRAEIVPSSRVSLNAWVKKLASLEGGCW